MTTNINNSPEYACRTCSKQECGCKDTECQLPCHFYTEQAEQEPVVERKWPLMGYGSVAIGGSKQPDGTSCLLYLDMGETRDIDADTTDLFPVGSEADPSKLMACIYFKDGVAIQQTIDVLREMQVELGYAAPIEPVKQGPVMDYERLNALREGEQNGAEDAYFFVRPENDTPTLRKMFCQGFERGFHKGLKYTSHAHTKDLTDDEIAALFQFDDYDFARAVIAADREKNK